MKRKFSEFWKVKYSEDHKHYYSEVTKKLLLSFTSITRPLFELDNGFVPPQTLNDARDYGKTLMTNLEAVINNQTPFESLTVFWQSKIIDLLNKIKTTYPGIKLIQCEKMLCSGTKIGFLDLVGQLPNKKYVVFEIKTISDYKNKPKSAWLSQLAYYNIICKENNISNNKYALIVFDRKKEIWYIGEVDKKVINRKSMIINNYINNY